MLATKEIKQQAREHARNVLAQSSSFQTLSIDEKKEVYTQLVKDEMNKLSGASSNGVSTALKINDDRHEKDFEDAVDAFDDLVGTVDFPKFVADLLKSVFDANIDVMKAQTEDFMRIMKLASQDLSSFIKKVDNTAAFGYLAENESDDFNIAMEEDGSGGEKMSLTKPDGTPVNMDDNEVKAKIMESKIKMAQEHRAMMREIMSMGITRLVVEDGEVSAGVKFKLTSHREATRKDKEITNRSKSTGGSISGGGGILSLFGAPRGGGSRSTRKTRINVSTAESKNTDDLSGELTGNVKIKFKTDYFKLDNFAQMYGPVSDGDKKAASGK